MEAMTVRQLMNACANAIKDGYGNHKILISNDDEGNGYHELFYAISPIKEKELEYIENYMLPFGVNKNDLINYVTLG